MATSGATNWTLTRDQIISSALRKLGVLASGQSPTTNQVNDAATALNAIVKAFQADGMPVWKIKTYTFTTVANQASYVISTDPPLKVIEAIRVQGGTQVSMEIFNRYDYYNLPSSSTGTPVHVYYQPKSGTGTAYLWPTPVDTSVSITLHYHAMYEDFVANTDNADFPTYWLNALIYALAWTLSPEYGLPITDRKDLAASTQYWKDLALSFGSEEGSITFSPSKE